VTERARPGKALTWKIQAVQFWERSWANVPSGESARLEFFVHERALAGFVPLTIEVLAKRLTSQAKATYVSVQQTASKRRMCLVVRYRNPGILCLEVPSPLLVRGRRVKPRRSLLLRRKPDAVTGLCRVENSRFGTSLFRDLRNCWRLGWSQRRR